MACADGSDLEQALDFLFGLLAGRIPYDRICLALIDPEEASVVVRWCRSHQPLKLKIGFRAALAGSTLLRIVEQGAPRVIDDLEAYLEEHPSSETTRLIVEEGMRSSLVSPLVIQAKAVGFLFFSSTRRGVFGKDHVAVAQRIAGLVAPIVEKDRLLMELSLRDKTLREHEGELQKARGELDRFFSMSMDLLCVAGGDGYFKVVSPSFERVLGYTREEMLAIPIVDFVHPDDRVPTTRELKRLGRGKLTVSFENRYRCKDGAWRWLEWNAAPVGEDGLIHAVARDVTAHKELNRQLRAIVVGAPVAMVLTDRQDRIVLANERMGAIFGYTPEELAGVPNRDLVPERMREKYVKVRTGLFESGGQRDFGTSGDLYGLRKDRSEVPIEIATTPIEIGEKYLLSAVTDISKRKKSMDRVRTIVESSPDAILLVGPDGMIALVNSAAERIFGYNRAELVGNPLEILIPERFRRNHVQQRQQFAKAGQERRMGNAAYELCGLHKGGREVPLDIALKPIEMEEGRFVICTARDLTERKRVEEEFSTARQVQRALLPKKLPELPGWGFAADSRPAEATCGDFINFTPLPDGRLVFAIGDVSGHGLGPAILTASAMSYLRAFARSELRLQEILQRTNSLLFDDTRPEDYATALVGRLDPGLRTLRYASAGHPQGYVFDREGNLHRKLDSTGFPLGLFEEVEEWEMNTVTLNAGDTVVLITDGIFEAMSPTEEMFDHEGVCKAVRAALDGGPEAILESIYTAVAEFSRRSTRDDDMTVMIIRAPDR